MGLSNNVSVLRRNNVHVRGTGERAIVFVNGFGYGQEAWRHVTPSFERDYVTVLYDHVGSGGSQLAAYSSSRYCNFAAYAADLVEIGRELGLQQAAVVGHSCGAMIAALAAIREQSLFDRLIMIAPSARYLDDGDYIGGFNEAQIRETLALLGSDLKAWTLRMAPLFMGNPERPELSDELIGHFLQLDPTVASDFARVIFESDLREEIGQVPTRSLILQCSDDCVAPPSAGRYVHDRVAGSAFVQMDARGHFPHLSAPRDTVSAIATFLSAAPRANGGGRPSLQAARRLSLVRQGVQLLGVPQRPAHEPTPNRDDELLESLLARLGELWMHLGRYDMYALSLQELLRARFGADETRFTLRTRGHDIARLLALLSRELSAHFIETRIELEAVLGRHEISARNGATIAGLTLESTGTRPAVIGRDWFDQTNAGTQDWAEILEQVERDILKVVALCFRVSHCALAVQRALRLHASPPAVDT